MCATPGQLHKLEFKLIEFKLIKYPKRGAVSALWVVFTSSVSCCCSLHCLHLLYVYYIYTMCSLLMLIVLVGKNACGCEQSFPHQPLICLLLQCPRCMQCETKFDFITRKVRSRAMFRFCFGVLSMLSGLFFCCFLLCNFGQFVTLINECRRPEFTACSVEP